MYLINIFTPALYQAKQIAGTIQQTGKGDYESIIAQIKQTIEQSQPAFEKALKKEQFFQEKYLDSNHYWLGLYAVVTYIDELMIRLPWDGASKWQNYSFQRMYFETFMGGKEFFDKLDQLSVDNPGDQEVRKVYFYCLCLGFEGEYYYNKDKLADVIQENYQLLHIEETSFFEKKQVFESDYKNQQLLDTNKKQKFLLKMLFIAPFIVIPVIYFIFRLQILAISQSIGTIF